MVTHMAEEVDLSGRSKLTDWRVKGIIDAIAKNIPYKLAAEANGIGERTFYDWLTYAKEDREAGIESDFTHFSRLVKETEMKKIDEHLEYMEAGGKNWQARAWILERRWRQLFGVDAGGIEELTEKVNKVLALHGEGNGQR